MDDGARSILVAIGFCIPYYAAMQVIVAILNSVSPPNDGPLSQAFLSVFYLL